MFNFVSVLIFLRAYCWRKIRKPLTSTRIETNLAPNFLMIFSINWLYISFSVSGIIFRILFHEVHFSKHRLKSVILYVKNEAFHATSLNISVSSLKIIAKVFIIISAYANMLIGMIAWKIQTLSPSSNFFYQG